MEHFFSCLIFRPSKWSIFSGLVIIVVVYVFLLRNPTDSAVEKVWVPPDLNKPIILEWAKEPPEHLITFLNAYPSNSATKCPYECYFTTDRRLLNSAKMVVFHPVNLDLNDLPPHRCNNQHYVFFTRESPPNIKNSDFEKLSSDYFNISMTYRLDSDIFAGYDRFEKIDNGTLQYETWMDMEVIEKVSKKKRLILQFVSNCDTPSNREAYIEVLKKYINITQFGTCYEGFIHKIFNVHDCTGSCEDEEIDQHYFYLAFENSVCKHYVSEKFWRLKKLIVPIVLNRKVYEGIAPNNSFIAVDDFESPMKLAAYLHYLMTHQDEYMNCLIFRPSKWSIFSGLVIIVVVYVFLLRNPTNSAVEKVWVPPDLNKPIILEWAKDPPEHLISFLNAYPSNSANKCPYECYFTTDRRLLNSTKMVVFHPSELDVKDLPPHRYNNQLYVFFTRESPPKLKHWGFEKLSSDFNVSMTYRLDSDIFAGYDRFEEIDNGTLKHETWMNMEVIEKVSKKKKLALQFVSNCDTPSNREAYIEVLKKYINITQFGTCYEGLIHSAMRILYTFNVRDCIGSCEDEEIDQHYFYLAFENSVCKHYASEKFWRLKKLIVPIVLNRKVYEGIAPNNSFIAVDDFESPMKLAAYLHYLMIHQDEYMKYFQWTKFYKKTKAYSNARCELCTIATNQNKKTINDIRQWWINDSHCISNYGKILLKGHKT